MYDVIIIGGGPAGVSAAIYSARKKMKTLVLASEIGGQSTVSGGIENWIGNIKISGLELAENLEKHLRAQPDIDVHTAEVVSGIEKTEQGFHVVSDKGSYMSKTIVMCAGSHRRRLEVPGEAEFDGKGVMFCATCDAPIFSGQPVAVVGGGNAGLESVVDLMPYASHITLLVRGDAPKGDAVTYEKVMKSDKVNVLNNVTVKRILGSAFLTGLVYTDMHGEDHELPLQGVFVEIGSIPSTAFVPKEVERNALGEIIINHRTGETSCAGFFAAGDATNVAFKQNNISAGDGIKAALSAYSFVHQLPIKPL